MLKGEGIHKNVIGKWIVNITYNHIVELLNWTLELNMSWSFELNMWAKHLNEIQEKNNFCKHLKSWDVLPSKIQSQFSL
jgi:hypothetical protein